MKKASFTCRICDNNQLKYFYSLGNSDEFDFFRCEKCGLVNLDLTNEDIFSNQQQYFDRFIPPTDYEKAYGAKDSFNFVSRYVPRPGKFLDIGCGSGTLLYFARKKGWDVQGLEILPQFAEHVKTSLGIEIEVANFLEYEGKEEKFDLVSLRHVLEHLPDSKLAVNKIHSFLNPGGFAHFEFPNIDGIPFKIKRFMRKNGFYKRKHKPGFRPGHCNEFNKETFTYLMDISGFELIRWETYSFKPWKNFIYNHWHTGVKARVLVKKV